MWSLQNSATIKIKHNFDKHNITCLYTKNILTILDSFKVQKHLNNKIYIVLNITESLHRT